jgi:hypothetical protein
VQELLGGIGQKTAIGTCKYTSSPPLHVRRSLGASHSQRGVAPNEQTYLRRVGQVDGDARKWREAFDNKRVEQVSTRKRAIIAFQEQKLGFGSGGQPARDQGLEHDKNVKMKSREIKKKQILKFSARALGCGILSITLKTKGV